MDIPTSGSTGVIPAIPHDVLVKQKQGQAISMWMIGAFCIYGWDMFICAPKEYRLVWRKPMNPSSLLYLINRYFGLLEFCFTVSLSTSVWSASGCKRIYRFEPIAGVISTVLSQAILGNRVFAIYSRNKRLGYVLGAILLAEAVVGGVSISAVPPPTFIPGAPAGSQVTCGALNGPVGWLITYWTMPLLYDFLTFGLTAWKAYELRERGTKTRLFNVIWFDGLIYFFANLMMNVVNVMIFFLAPLGLRDFNMAPTIMFQVILSCRMFLHLKGFNQPTDFSISNSNSNNHINFKVRSHVSNKASLPSSGTDESNTASRQIDIDTKRATVVGVQEYELNARVKSSEVQEGWEMA